VTAANFSRLSTIWSMWAPQAGLTSVVTSLTCGDCEITFQSADYSVHLRRDGDGWAIDVIDDRDHRSNGVAKFSTFDLAEKYLVWNWANFARSGLASGPLGTDLYKLGYAPGVGVSELDRGNVELCVNGDCATLVVGDATIFSHIMTKSVDEIVNIAARAGLQSLTPRESN
jgi:hypothetical protein